MYLLITIDQSILVALHNHHYVIITSLLSYAHTSTTNVKKWESEMQTLKKNNDRLTMALEESSQHVAQWKLQLHKYKEENDSLKLKVVNSVLRSLCPLTLNNNMA
jgi:ribonucleotide reductase beta subunit family protein with ferritin-like domain